MLLSTILLSLNAVLRVRQRQLSHFFLSFSIHSLNNQPPSTRLLPPFLLRLRVSARLRFYLRSFRYLPFEMRFAVPCTLTPLPFPREGGSPSGLCGLRPNNPYSPSPPPSPSHTYILAYSSLPPSALLTASLMRVQFSFLTCSSSVIVEKSPLSELAKLC